MHVSRHRSSSSHGMLPIVVGSIMVVGLLTGCALLHSVCDLKASQMKVQHCLIWELILYGFELSPNRKEETNKKIS